MLSRVGVYGIRQNVGIENSRFNGRHRRCRGDGEAPWNQDGVPSVPHAAIVLIRLDRWPKERPQTATPAVCATRTVDSQSAY